MVLQRLKTVVQRLKTIVQRLKMIVQRLKTVLQRLKMILQFVAAVSLPRSGKYYVCTFKKWDADFHGCGG